MNITFLVAVATIGIVMLIFFLVIFILLHQRKMMAQNILMKEKESAHQKALLNASLEIAEQERAKTAANIHDDLGMMLHVMKLNISKIKRNIHDPGLSLKLLEDNDELLKKTLDTIRIISHDLMPSTLLNVGFIEAMIDLCDRVNELGALRTELKTGLQHIGLESRNSLQLYRLVKEVLNNIVKHAKASHAEIEITVGEKNLLITITHDGKGITNEAIAQLARSGTGVGLRSILGRAQLLNASVQYLVPENDKSKIIVKTPL